MLVPTGTYRARAVEAELCSMSQGTEHVHVLFEIVEGDFEGQFVPWFGFFAETTALQTVQALRFCGWRGCDLSNLEGVKDEEVSVGVDHWLRDGRTHARVGEVRHASRLLAAEPMPLDRARVFAERLRAFILGLRHRPVISITAEEAGFRGGDTQRLLRPPSAERAIGAKAASLGEEIAQF